MGPGEERRYASALHTKCVGESKLSIIIFDSFVTIM